MRYYVWFSQVRSHMMMGMCMCAAWVGGLPILFIEISKSLAMPLTASFSQNWSWSKNFH